MIFIRKHIKVILFYFLLAIANALIIILINHKTASPLTLKLRPETINAILAVLGAFDLFCLTPLSTPMKNWINNVIFDSSNIFPCDISIIGESGTGKSTLISSWVGGTSSTPAETMYAEYYKASRFIKSKHVPFRILDYKGQQATQPINEVLSGRFEPFVIIFLVDLIPIKYTNDGKEQKILDEASQMQWLKNNIDQRIEERINHHNNNYTGFGLPICLDLLQTKKLKCIKFVINKVDVLEKTLIDEQQNNDQINDQIDKIKQKFKSVENSLKNICREKGIEYDIEIISAKSNKGTLELLEKILEKYIT